MNRLLEYHRDFHYKASYAIKKVVEVNSMRMTACDLNESLDCFDDIHQGKFNIIYASAEAAMEKRLHNSLKAKDL